MKIWLENYNISNQNFVKLINWLFGLRFIDIKLTLSLSGICFFLHSTTAPKAPVPMIWIFSNVPHTVSSSDPGWVKSCARLPCSASHDSRKRRLWSSNDNISFVCASLKVTFNEVLGTYRVDGTITCDAVISIRGHGGWSNYPNVYIFCLAVYVSESVFSAP